MDNASDHRLTSLVDYINLLPPSYILPIFYLIIHIKKLEDDHYQLTMDKNDIQASNTFLAYKIDEYNYKFTLIDKSAKIHGVSNVEFTLRKVE